MADIINPDALANIVDGVAEPDEITGGVGDLTPDNLNLILSGANVAGKTRTDELAVEVAMAQGRTTDEQAVNLAKAEPMPENALSIASEQVFMELEQKLRDAERGFGEINPSDLPAVIDQLIAGQEKVNQLRNSSVSTELSVIEKATTIPLQEEVRNTLALNLAVRTEISSMLESQSKLDFISDIGGNFIPFRLGMDFEDVKEGVQEHAELKRSIDGNSIEGMISTWQALPLGRKQDLIKPLTEAILAATGVDYGFGLKTDKNVLNAAGILLRFLQPEGGERAKRQVVTSTALDAAFGFGSLKFLSGGAEAVKVGTAVANINKLSINTRKIMEGIVSNSGNYTRKLHNPIKLIKDSGDITEAAKVNQIAMTREPMAKAYGLSTTEAYSNAMPSRANSFTPGKIEGMSAETAKIVNSFMRDAEGLTRGMTVESNLIRIGALSKSDRALVVRNFYDDMELKAEDLLQEGIHLTDLKVIKQDSTGFTYEYTLANEAVELIPAGGGTGVPVPETHKAFRSWRINEVTGNFDETTKDLAAPSASSIPGVSPAAWSVTKPGAGLDFNDAVKDALILTDTAVAAKDRISKLWVEANSTISGLGDVKARRRIESIELAGDEYVNRGTQIRGKTFTENELIAGVQTSTGTIRLTNPKEVQAYYKRRVIADQFWAMQNYVSRRELELGGFKATTLKGDDVIAKPFDTPEAAMASAANNPGFNVYLMKEDITTPLTNDIISSMYADGKVLVRMREDWNTTGAGSLARGGEFVEYAFINRERVRELPEAVLHYRPGYVPKINEGIEFVVKQKYPMNKAGAQGKTKDEALRAFSSRKDADEFIRRQVNTFVAKNPQANPEDVAKLFEVADGSAMAQLERMENSLSGSGGLYTGARSADELLMGLDGVPLERMSPTEAFGRYIDHLGNVLTKNEWRIGKEQEWINTVRNMDSSIKIEGFNGTRLPNTPEGKALGQERDQINVWNRVPTRQESMFEGQVQKVHDWMLDGARGMGIDKQNIKSALWLKHSEPASALLTANMHVMLGALNPAQLYVQSSAAVVAMSLSKISDIPNIIKSTAQIAAMDNVQNSKAFNALLDLLNADKQLSPEDAEIFTAWKRSGLYESVRSNADLNYLASTGVGLTNDFLRKADNISLLIYRAGELTNRRVSFISAFKRWRQANPKAPVNDDNLATVIKEANLTMLELNAANKAWWQGGSGATAAQKIFSMTGQFQQVLTKTMELAMKTQKRGGFSTAQKKRIATGQLLMFGAAGIPPLAILAPSFFDWVGVEPDETTTNVINQGTVGFIAQSAFGADVDVANRAALGASVAETLKDIVVGRDPLWTKLLAVTGASGQRAAEAGQEIGVVLDSQVFSSLQEIEPLLMADRTGQEAMDVPTMLQTAQDIGKALAKIPSSGRNIFKARMMHNANRILDRRGRVVIERDFDFATELGQALGFRPSAETRLRMVQMSNKEVDEMVDEGAQTIIQAYHRYVYTHNMNDAYASSVVRTVQLVQETMDNPELVDRLMRNVENRIFNNAQTLEERELKKFYERLAPDKLTQGVILDTTRGLNPSNIFNQQAIVQPFSQTLETEEQGDK